MSADQGRSLRVTTRNARFQQWEALLSNRTKRHRSASFLIHGVRPITLATECDWPLVALLHSSGHALSAWARTVIDSSAVDQYALSPELMHELGGKADEAPEIIGVGRMLPDELTRIDPGSAGPVVVFDRPTSPGNLGTLIRSSDAFGASGVVVCGHAADIYDPRTVRASTGSLFALPTVHSPSARDVLAWIGDARAGGCDVRVVGTDERGSTRVDQHDFSAPTVLVVGNETTGLSAAWREACTDLVSVPIGGAASSLNAASAGAVVLYEIARQRGFPAPDRQRARLARD
ncbi:MAG: TrmH family RNA methyltransferase [Actinomycetes bacterium]